MKSYDIIVIGGGHAGIEAARACALMNCSTALITMSEATIGVLSCNPLIGGSAKGHLVKEIDAIGGIMPLIADRSGLQFKMLNTSKGPAIWSPRSQNDKFLYPKYARQVLKQTKNLEILQGTVEKLLISNKEVYGVIYNGQEIRCKALILCGGTFLNGMMYTGKEKTIGGRVNEKAAQGLSNSLLEHGFEIGRLKTGTPPRIYADSIDHSKVRIESGDEIPKPFSHKTKHVKNTMVCYGTNTSKATHEILEKGFIDSPMFTGLITGRGPRYCPSIEDKIYRFQERESHQIILEPESLFGDTIYVNGFSTAGQINGTSGYEEAASQGLIAGINAAAKIKGLPELILERSDAYIGVMIDDLVNKSSDEPYRIFTSLAEYRLLLRQDNAFERLYEKTAQYGLHDGSEKEVLKSIKMRKELEESIKTVRIPKDLVNEIYLSVDETSVKESELITTMCKRPSVNLSLIREKTSALDSWKGTAFDSILWQADIDIKYEGYIARHLADIEKFKELEHKVIPAGYDYDTLTSLSSESREKLKKIKPHSIGQASRIPGVSPTDISLLVIDLKR